MVLWTRIFMSRSSHCVTEGESPFICGGRSGGDYTDTCYMYEASTDEWIPLGIMEERRGWSGYDSSGRRLKSID